MSVDFGSIIVQLLILAGVIYTGWKQKQQTPAQKESDIITNYAALIEQYRKRIAELEVDNDRVEKERRENDERHQATIVNFEAVMQKRDIESREETMRLKKDRDAYAIAYTGIRRIAVKYVPADVVLPEVNGNTKDLK